MLEILSIVEREACIIMLQLIDIVLLQLSASLVRGKIEKEKLDWQILCYVLIHMFIYD